MIQTMKRTIAAYHIQLMEAQTGPLQGSRAAPEPDTEEGESTASSSGTIIHSDDSDLTINCSGNTHHV